MKSSIFSITFRLLLGFGLALALPAARAATPGIVITNVPAFGATGYLSGYVTNADFTTNSLAVFIYWPNENPSPAYDKKLSPFGWFSRPTCPSQLTPINPDGSWSCNITTSNLDIYATEIAVLLVPTNYSQACVAGATSLPTADINKAEAIVYADRVNSNRRLINWSGYGWWVKTAGYDGNEFLGATGPGPNNYCDSTNSAWVDAQGQLHLQILYTNSAWQSVELYSDESFGYGQYRVTINANIYNLDSNVVFSMFTWSDDEDYNDREIDIELTHWSGTEGAATEGDFAVAPYNTGQTLYFSGIPATVTNSTHWLNWTPTNVVFQSLNGNYTPTPAATNILESWSTSVSPIPPEGGENLLLILWLYKGKAPQTGLPVQVTLSQFQFDPLPSQAAQLTQPKRLANGQFQFGIQGVPQGHYAVLSSSNLTTWTTNGPILRMTNQANVFPSYPLPAVTTTFTDTNPPSPGYYKVLTVP